MPSDQSYRFPVWVILFLLLSSLLGVWMCIVMLRSRMKHAWPW